VLSRAAIRRKCAFTYMNAFSGKNLTDARAVDANDVRTALDAGAGIRRCHRHRAVSPDGRDMHVGRERPPEAGHGAKKGAAKWGSLTPYWPLCSAATAASTRDRRLRTPPAADGKRQTRKEIERP
jgi:hypothetical protein